MVVWYNGLLQKIVNLQIGVQFSVSPNKPSYSSKDEGQTVKPFTVGQDTIKGITNVL